MIKIFFLWGGGAFERRPNLVKWEVVCLDKNRGGLGIKKLSTFNKALFVNGVSTS